jgi:putative ABC transport system substrate-binding protein
MVEPDRQALDVHAGRRAVLAGAAIAVAAAMAPRTARAQTLAQTGTCTPHRVAVAGRGRGGRHQPRRAPGRARRARAIARGGNLVIETRWAEGGSEQLSGLARELAKLKVDVICTAGTQATRAARDATSTIPVVFANVAFPVQQQLVASVAHPGGNVTGVAFLGPEYGKRLEVLKQVAPRLGRVGIIYNPENQGSVIALDETKRWAQSLGVALEPYRLRGPHDIDESFNAIAKSRPDAVMTTADPLIASYRAASWRSWRSTGSSPSSPAKSGSTPEGSCSTAAAFARCTGA